MPQIIGSEPAFSTNKSFTLEIAGIRLQFKTDDPEINFSMAGAGRLFLVPENGIADSVLHFGLGELTEEVSGELLFDSGATWQLYRTAEGHTLRLATDYYGPVPYRIAQFNHDFRIFQKNSALRQRPFSLRVASSDCHHRGDTPC